MKAYLKAVAIGAVVLTMLGQTGCASTGGITRKVALGMLAGAVAGAVVGHEFLHNGSHRQYETRNTIISSIVFALGTGGVLAWHYQALEDKTVEISAQYSRYRLCNPDDQPDFAKKLGMASDDHAYQLQKEQFGKYAISLDDSTKWTYPTFRKRYLPPERGENQVVSTRYIWEVLKPGSFVTRTQDPEFFVDDKSEPTK